MPIELPDDFIIDLDDKIKNMKVIRIKGKLTQQDIADKLGVTQGRVANWEKGTDHPQYNSLVLLTRLLDTIQLETAEDS